jgi:hypothetical protein
MRVVNAKKYLIILALESILAATLWWASPAGGREVAPQNPCLANVVFSLGAGGHRQISGHMMVFPASSQWVFNLSWREGNALRVMHRQLDVRFQDLGKGRFKYFTRGVARYRDDTVDDDPSIMFPMLQAGNSGSMTFTPMADRLFNVQVNEDFQFYCTEQ